MKRVLFLNDLYCSGNPDLGLSNHSHNIIDTFSYCRPEHQVFLLNYDQTYMLGRHIDNILPQYCQKFKIDLIFISLLGNSGVNPSFQCLEAVKKLGIKLVFIWWDANPTEINLQNATSLLSDLNIVLDYPTSDLHNQRRENHLKTNKYLYLWTPESKNLYYPDKQDIDVSFIGSTRYPDRAEYCKKLQEAFPNIYIRGGQREEGRLSPEGYASLIRRSKININFSKNPDGYDQFKGRCLESCLSKTLLMEESGGSTPNFLTPSPEIWQGCLTNFDYVQFLDADDLIKKIKYYQENPTFAQQIAENGYNECVSSWSAFQFWNQVMDKVNKL